MSKSGHGYQKNLALYPAITLWQPNGTTTAAAIGPQPLEEGNPSNVTPVTGSVNQYRRRRYANVVTTPNQALGLRWTDNTLYGLTRGGGPGAGGFYVAIRFVLGVFPTTGARLFVGLSASTTAIVTAESSAIPVETIGIAHDAGDPANKLWYVSRASGSANTPVELTGATIATGQGFLAEFYHWEGASNTHMRFTSLNTRTKIGSQGLGTFSGSAPMVSPHIQVSNGTAHTAANAVAIDIISIYADVGNEW